MKVALVFPRFTYPSGDPPLGVAYLAGAIRMLPGLKVDILDTTFESSPMSYLAREFKRERYDLVGISLMSSMVTTAFRVAALAKQVIENTRVIMGGPHPTVMPEQMQRDPNVDAVCVGEAETTLPLLMRRFPDLEVPGMFTSSGRNEPRPPAADLDSLQPPAWDLLPMRQYMRNWFQLDSVPRAGQGTSILASRGCPYNCTYCQPTLRRLFGPKLRKRTPASVAAEVSELTANHGLESFMFQDDTFTIDRDWALEVAREVHRRNPSVIWGCNARADTLDEEFLRELHACGLRKLNMGIESATQRILDEVYKKKIAVEDLVEAVHTAKRAGLTVQGYFMIGAPTETLEEIHRTIRLACELPLDDATFSITTPLPGTALYRKTAERIRPGTRDFNYYDTSVYRSADVLQSSVLRALTRKAYLKFYFSPRRWSTLLRHVILSGGPRKTASKIRRLF